jgi:hypothetical protein
MLRLTTVLIAAASACLAMTTFGQVLSRGPTASPGSPADAGEVGVTGCSEGGMYLIEVPNLILGERVLDPFYGGCTWTFRPEVINLDGVTVRQVLELAGTDIDCPGYDLLIQAVCVDKNTPYWKCTAFVAGPGSGANTNFTTGWRYADSTMLDESVIWIAFGQSLGCRSLLFSPPLTKYRLKVAYVRRDQATGQVGPVYTSFYEVQVIVPSRDQIAKNIEYFSTVAAGVTQKPKITADVANALRHCLTIPENLEALVCFESVIALASIDFKVLRDKDGCGFYDARFFTGYMVDSDEEPIGCLLIEMANAALWF